MDDDRPKLYLLQAHFASHKVYSPYTIFWIQAYPLTNIIKSSNVPKNGLDKQSYAQNVFLKDGVKRVGELIANKIIVSMCKHVHVCT